MPSFILEGIRTELGKEKTLSIAHNVVKDGKVRANLLLCLDKSVQ